MSIIAIKHLLTNYYIPNFHCPIADEFTNPIIITQEIVVNKDCLSVLEEIELTRPDFKVIHKGAVGEFHKPPPEDVDPVKVLRQYIESKSLRIWDFFKQYDKDKSMSVSTEEFRKGIMVRPK